MGKGDKKTRKGKIIKGSYGKKRPRTLPKRKSESTVKEEAVK
ncbi:MAG: 30S ribosomal protein THX, partial [Sphingobacterium sp.]